MSIARTEALFWLAATFVIVGILAAAAPLRHTHYNHVIFWTRVVGGLIVFRVGMQAIWSGMRSRHRPQLWAGVSVAVIGLYLVYLGLVALGLNPRVIVERHASAGGSLARHHARSAMF